MDIERVNENTLKLFISYRDIEDRGYSREEIWYNRQKGEELFWDMIGEINTDDYFDLDGPIWIHVNASEQGLEVIVTRANMTSEESGLLASLEDTRDSVDHKSDDSMYDSMDDDESGNGSLAREKFSVYKFKDIDEIIPLANRLVPFGLPSSLYTFENSYYVAVDFSQIEEVKQRKNIRAIINEYMSPSKLTIYRLQEYGVEIMSNDCFETVLQYFD
nr:adaptor protein MecA [Lysinibacillus timonensis]